MKSSPIDLMYTAEVAELLEVGTRTIHRMVLAGRLVPVARGRGKTSSMLFARADVEALLKVAS